MHKKFIAILVFIFVLSCLLGRGVIQAQTGGEGMKISSPEFKHNQSIPRRFTCQGQDISPRLEIEGIPEGTQSLALIMDDPDAPMGTWVHWVVFNIPATSAIIEEDSVPGEQAGNNFGRKDYGGPCPPSGTHRYFFKIYALDTVLESGIRDKASLERSMQEHILAQAELIGLYKKY